MKTKEEKLAYLDRIFRASVNAGMCRTMKEFAALLNVDKSGLSSAMNGSERHLTDSLIRKVENYASLNRLEAEAVQDQPEVKAQPSGIYIPQETLDLYTNLSETCRNLSAIVARLGIQAPAQPGWTSPKNYQTD